MAESNQQSRLREWLDTPINVRTHAPYANPGELKADVQSLFEQLETYGKALESIIVCSTISHAWSVSKDALAAGSNPASEREGVGGRPGTEGDPGSRSASSPASEPEMLTVWWWTPAIDEGVIEDGHIPVPFEIRLPADQALDHARELVERANVTWVKVFGAAEHDERFHWPDSNQDRSPA